MDTLIAYLKNVYIKFNFFIHNQENVLLIKQITYDQGEDINYD